jgi:hypothetical protein
MNSQRGFFGQPSQPRTSAIPAHAIYVPAGKAREYAAYAVNLYRGCAHGCLYCYAPSACQRPRAEFHAHPAPRPGIIDALRRDLRDGPPAEEILLCFTSDPYQPIEERHEVTRRALELLAEAGAEFTVLTKAGTLAQRDFDVLEKARARFGVSLCWTDDAERAKWEPGAATVAERIANLRAAKAAGIPTWVSVEPIFDLRQAAGCIAALHDCVDFWKIGKLNHRPEAAKIDWRAVCVELTGLLDSLHANYYVKNDLRKFAPMLDRQRTGGIH